LRDRANSSAILPNDKLKHQPTSHKIPYNPQHQNLCACDAYYCPECAQADEIEKINREQRTEAVTRKPTIIKSPIIAGTGRPNTAATKVEDHWTTFDSNVSMTQNSPRSATGSVLHDLSNLQEKHQYFAHILNTVEEYVECSDSKDTKTAKN